MEKSKSPSCAFCRGYVDDKIFPADLASDLAIPISSDLIEKAREIIYEKGIKIKIIKIDGIRPSQDYFFSEGLVRINPPFIAPHIELHSETKKGLEKLMGDLGLL